MNTLPFEILAAVAAQLPAIVDVGNFRLVEKRCASAAFHVLFHRIQILNTVDCLNNIQELITSPYGSRRTPRHLTLHHATWPQVWTTWQQHSLRTQPIIADAQALEGYLHFIQTEAIARTPQSHESRIQKVLRQFVQLQSLSITDVQSLRHRPARNQHLENLKRRIRIVPSFQGRLNNILEDVSQVFNLMPCLTALSLEGSLDVRTISFPGNFPQITQLRITGLLMSTAISDDLYRFVIAFPNLNRISLRPTSLGIPSERSVPLKAIYLANLRHAELHDIWTSESTLLDFVCQNKLQSLSLTGLHLIQGSWESFFTQLRVHLPEIQFDGNGMLWASESRGYWLDMLTLKLLRMYLVAQDLPWPFV